MKDAAPQTIYLKDYTPPAYLVDKVELTFRLAPSATRVLSKIAFRPNPEAKSDRFFLHGEQLKLISAKINGTPVTPELCDGGLVAPAQSAPFVWEAEVEIDPAGNTALEGLYMSGGMYCTQCEAEGFRKITYYPDRPDVLAPFSVRIESDAPILLSNGNKGRVEVNAAEWHDPWPKPSYLFALVAGDLVNVADTFTTRSGKDVELNIWVRKGDEDKCDFGLDALKRSMKWDEDVYGREYDLDIFNIVAVDDFNMGAMENKGLNIFNSSCVLASPETSTDASFERIEAIIAHEYFHNWTGNRITCRDWFQLCLKEGLTVFRDQQFTGDMRSHAVKRIDDAQLLRARQFREDGGPLAHPVRPESFVEINNFYTVTVYEKGAEIIGMLKRLVGDAAYAKALDLYFDRHDGEAATIEDWITVFQDATGRDLSQFALWYSQSGTPRLSVRETWEDGTFTLHFTQVTPPTPDQADKQPLVLPIAVGLLAPNGDEIQSTVILEMTQAEQSFAFTGLAEEPIPSILRDFSAPVVFERAQSPQERTFLLAHDTDPYNQWEAGNALAKDGLIEMILNAADPNEGYLNALGLALRDETLDPAFRAKLVALPSEEDMARAISDLGHTPQPEVIRDMRQTLRRAIAGKLGEEFANLYLGHQVAGTYSPDAGPAGKRALTNAALNYITLTDSGAAAVAQFAAADNMTQELAALCALLSIDAGSEELTDFAQRWSKDRLVMDNWFSVQVSYADPDDAAAVAEKLTRHADFDWKNPNRFRAVFGALAGNHAGFHHKSGRSYRLLADWLIKLDPLNPQTTARMCGAFQTWPRYDQARQAMIKAELERILDTPGLSRDTHEMVSRIIAN